MNFPSFLKMRDDQLLDVEVGTVVELTTDADLDLKKGEKLTVIKTRDINASLLRRENGEEIERTLTPISYRIIQTDESEALVIDTEVAIFSKKPELPDDCQFHRIEEIKVIGYDVEKEHSQYDGWGNYYRVSHKLPVRAYRLLRADIKAIRAAGMLSEFAKEKRLIVTSDQIFNAHRL